MEFSEGKLRAERRRRSALILGRIGQPPAGLAKARPHSSNVWEFTWARLCSIISQTRLRRALLSRPFAQESLSGLDSLSLLSLE